VILRDLGDDAIPARPISAKIPLATDSEMLRPPPLLLGLLAIGDYAGGGADFAKYMADQAGVPECPQGVPVRDLPRDCHEAVATPQELFAKLHEWHVPSLVIPHGTTWGFYTPLGSSWDKQLTREQHDPSQQKLIEVYSGHGNSEQFRPYREVVFDADGKGTCPPPADNYLPSCWRAGEIIEARCKAEGGAETECAERAATARQNYLDAENNGGAATVPGAKLIDWQDAGQCRDCFQPAFNMRPQSVSIMSLEHEGAPPMRFRLASRSRQSLRPPGTGYKEVARTEFTEARSAISEDPDRQAVRAAGVRALGALQAAIDQPRSRSRRSDRRFALNADSQPSTRPSQPPSDLGRAATQRGGAARASADPALARSPERAGRERRSRWAASGDGRRTALPGARGRPFEQKPDAPPTRRCTRRAQSGLCQGEVTTTDASADHVIEVAN
jgi:hypothetical protein